MDRKKQEKLDNTHKAVLDLMISDYPLDNLQEILSHKLMGYGTTMAEYITGIEGLIKLIENQRAEGEGIELAFDIQTIEKILNEDEDTAIIVNEITISMQLSEGNHEFMVRASMVYEYYEDTWKMIHWHASKPSPMDEDTWHINEWQKKNEELEQLVEEKTADLEKKNRELKIESALERIRSQVASMKESTELLDIVVTMRNEFLSLGHKAHYFWYMRYLPEIYEKAMTSGDGTRIGMVMTLPRHIHGDIKLVADWEKSDDSTIVFAMDVETAVDYISKMITLGDFKQVDPNAPTLDDIRHIGGLTFVMARTTYGEIGFSLPGKVPDPPQEDLDTLVRFAGVFDLAYSRFEDLKSAERQNRETKIEIALEKVRSRTLVMNEPNDLAETASLLYKQMNELYRLPANTRIHFSFIDAPSATAEVWITRDDGSVRQGSHRTPLLAIPSLKKAFDAWKNHESMIIRDYSGNELDQYIEFLSGLPHVKSDKGLQKMISDPPERIVYTDAIFSHGLLGIMSREPLEAEARETLMRFTGVFEMTYTRFLDMQSIKDEKSRTEKALENLKSTQKQLIHSEKMASLGELTAGIAHEIQNPLNFVNNFSEVSADMLDELNDELGSGNIEEVQAVASDLKENLEKISHHGHRASSIVKGMLEHSRAGDGKKELIDINELADEYLRLAYHGLRAKDKSFNAAFNADLDESVPKVEVIPQDLGRVLLNLVNNSFYAVSKRSKEGLADYSPEVTVETRNLDDIVEIRVRDNGGGIPDDILDKIFQPFFTTKPSGEGTGLGLSLAFDIIEKGNDGELKIENDLGKGVEFIITLPKKINI